LPKISLGISLRGRVHTTGSLIRSEAVGVRRILLTEGELRQAKTITLPDLGWFAQKQLQWLPIKFPKVTFTHSKMGVLSVTAIAPARVLSGKPYPLSHTARARSSSVLSACCRNMSMGGLVQNAHLSCCNEAYLQGKKVGFDASIGMTYSCYNASLNHLRINRFLPFHGIFYTLCTVSN